MEDLAQRIMYDLNFESIYVEISNDKLIDISYIDEKDQPWGQQEFIPGSSSRITMESFWEKIENAILTKEITTTVTFRKK